MSASVIQAWDERAVAYSQLVQRWPVFSEMCDLLLEAFAIVPGATIVDLGWGSGLCSERLLGRLEAVGSAVQGDAPIELYLFDPSPSMLALAESRLAPHAADARVRLHFGVASGEHLRLARPDAADSAAAPVQRTAVLADFVVSNAAVHLMDESLVFPAVAGALKPGGLFSFNVWCNTLEEYESLMPPGQERRFVDQALAESALPPIAWSQPQQRRQLKTVDAIISAGERSGLETRLVNVDQFDVSAAFSVEFAAMSEQWPPGVPSRERPGVVLRAAQLADAADPVSLYSARFLARKPG